MAALLNMSVNGIDIDLGHPMEFNALLGNVSTSLVYDTGAGLNAINSKLVQNIKILQRVGLSKKLTVTVGDSGTAMVEHSASQTQITTYAKSAQVMVVCHN